MKLMGQRIGQRIGRLVGPADVVALAVAFMIAFMSGAAFAQSGGDPVAGRALVRQICADCHAVEKALALSPNLAAPRFETIANVPGMTAAALAAVLRSSQDRKSVV